VNFEKTNFSFHPCVSQDEEWSGDDGCPRSSRKPGPRPGKVHGGSSASTSSSSTAAGSESGSTGSMNLLPPGLLASMGRTVFGGSSSSSSSPDAADKGPRGEDDESDDKLYKAGMTAVVGLLSTLPMSGVTGAASAVGGMLPVWRRKWKHQGQFLSVGSQHSSCVLKSWIKHLLRHLPTAAAAGAAGTTAMVAAPAG